MAARITLSDLRNAIEATYREVMREQGDWEASNTAILERVKAAKAIELAELTPDLVNIALIKLLNEVSGRRAGRASTPEGTDLFGEYRVPRSVTIVRGKKKYTEKLSFREAELYLKARAERSPADRHEPFRQLLEACREYSKNDEDTLEILISRKRQAEQLAI